mmetsp:Transcript_115817/g.327634  ORF Transcript_115817/g.327634 Transcript_115817/m.327634 type:complete len:277 (+) Transcript_115817:66-896(+)
MAAAAVLSPDVLRVALLPACDARTAVLLLGAARRLRGVVAQVQVFEVAIKRSQALGSLGARGLATAVAAMAGLRNLRLGLSYQEIGADAACNLAGAVSRLRGLRSVSVDLHRNGLGDIGGRAWAVAVGELPDLSHLDLRLGFNSLGGETIMGFITALGAPSAARLSEVQLALDINERIGGEAVCRLVQAVASLNGLQRWRLDLGACGVANEHAQLIAEALAGPRTDASEVSSLASPLWQHAELDLRGNGLRASARKLLVKAAMCLGAQGRQCIFRA